MKSRQGYKGFVIEAHAHELKDAGLSAECFNEPPGVCVEDLL